MPSSHKLEGARGRVLVVRVRRQTALTIRIPDCRNFNTGSRSEALQSHILDFLQEHAQLTSRSKP